MSRGIGAHAKKVLEDDETVIYEYGGYNLNEPEIHEKLKKMPSGRKGLITKRILVSVDYDKMSEDGTVKVENCNSCWHTTVNDLVVDVMACHILFHIFWRYQEEGEIPEYISYNV